MSLKMEIENVGGLTNKTITLKKGINRIRAPNAVGKTSLTKALELLTFSEDELRDKRHYSNLFVGSEERIKVKVEGEINHERIFRRIDRDNLLKEIGSDNPLVNDKGNRITNVCFAMPGNSLIEDFITGKDVRSYIELLAGTNNYKTAVAALNDISKVLSNKIRHYHDSVIKLNEYKKQHTNLKNELKNLREKFSKMPLLDEKEIFDDYERYNEKNGELDKLQAEVRDLEIKIRKANNSIESAKDNIKWLEDQIQLITSRSPQIESRLNWIAKEIPIKVGEKEDTKAQKAKTQEKLSAAQRNEVSITKHGDEGLCYACGKKMTHKELYSWTQKIKSELSDLNSIETKLRREIEDLETESEQLKLDQQDLATNQGDLRKAQKSLINRDGDVKEFNSTKDELLKDEKLLLKEIHDLSSSEAAFLKFQERRELKVKIDQKKLSLEDIEQTIKDLKYQIADVESLEDKYDFLQNLKNHLEIRKNQVVNEVVDTFNEKVTELYNRLGYKDFDDIQIGPTFRVSVTRKHNGTIVENFPLEALSTSERITIAIAFLLAAKEDYVNNFPFFVLDEIITSYDPERFKIMKEYLRNSEDYVLITELADDTTDVEVIHDAVTA